MPRSSYRKLEAFVSVPKENDKKAAWLEGAIDSFEWLQKNVSDDQDIVIYACNPSFFLHSVLASATKVLPPDHKDLQKFDIRPDHTWNELCMFNPIKGDIVGIESPFAETRCRSLVGGEKLIFERHFEGLKPCETVIEISQKLIQTLDLYYCYDKTSYCKINDQGDIEDIICIYFDSDETDYRKSIRAVTIKRSCLERYLVLSSMSMVSQFKFFRSTIESTHYIGESEEKVRQNDDIYLSHRVAVGLGSLARGHIIFRTNIKRDSIIEEWKNRYNSKGKEYATFIIHDRENNRLIETSCDPCNFSTQFEKSTLPSQMSPAYFRPDVLLRYRADPEKYTMDSGRISCRNSWDLRSCHINESRQVYSYICDLAELPYSEQLYWKSFNEKPKSDITKSSFETDFLGIPPSEYSPLAEIKAIVRRLDLMDPSWWSRRGSDLISDVQVPATSSTKVWGSELLALNKLILEGIRSNGLRAIMSKVGESVEKGTRPIDLLELTLSRVGDEEDQVADVVNTLKELSYLRNVIAAHSGKEKENKAVSNAIGEFGDLRAHFTDLLVRVRDSIKYIEKSLIKYT